MSTIKKIDLIKNAKLNMANTIINKTNLGNINLKEINNIGIDELEWMVPNEESNNQNTNISYNFEKAVEVTSQAEIVPSIEEFSKSLTNSKYNDLENFNNHIKKKVQKAGYGTREGIVAAAMALAYDYAKNTGKKLFYNDPGTSTDECREGITEDIKFDCRGFVWWSLYNGGFKWPENDKGELLNHSYEFFDWINEKGYTRETYDSGEIGDIVLKIGDNNHVMLIVGKYDDGYYIAEEAGHNSGLIVSKRDFSELEEKQYTITDLTEYYDDNNNKR